MSKEYHKSTAAEVDRRVSVVYSLLVKGWSRQQIWEYATKRSKLNTPPQVDPLFFDPTQEPGWDITIDMVDRYIARAKDLLKDKAQTVRQEVLGRTLERREDLYKESREHMDLKTALAVDQDTARLLDLYPEQKTRIQVEEVNPYAQLPVDRLVALLEDLDRATLPKMLDAGEEGRILDAVPVDK